ncbi:MAG: ParB N-terminal domain-containing protein [Candidatus Aminicenantes bacterium]|nr:ParB N-terminal domain-containing protein [Candidatus Aminicenantes bacterium]
MKLEDVPIEKIDFYDQRFRISLPGNLDKLQRSIAENGLINPPVVTLRSGRYAIVTGWKRAEVCRRLSYASLPCRVLDEGRDLHAFQTALQDSLTTKDLSICEQAEILMKLKGFGVDEDSLISRFLPMLGIPRTRNHLDTYLAVAALDPESKAFVHEKNTPLSVLVHLIELSRDGRERILPLLRPLGQNKQKELLEYLIDISRRDSVPVHAILASEEIQSVIRSAALSALQIADRVRMILKTKRYPALSSKTDLFLSSLKNINWPKDIAIDPPPFFEGEDITVKFTFKDSGEFRKKSAELKAMASEDRISVLLKSFSDD